MKVCILGASGMLGHMLFSELPRYGYDVCGTVRNAQPCVSRWGDRVMGGVDASDMAGVSRALDHFGPEVVINAVGIIRHLPEGREPLPCIRINAEFPHLLRQACARRNMRCIHYSTDCVFDGTAGRPYTEKDRVTASDVYGLTKFLGEIAGPSALTLRTSLIGPELRGKHSLLEWFLAQKVRIRGFTKALYTGLPTAEHARILAEYVLPRADLEGLYQVAAAPISKCELLGLVADAYGKEIDIVPDDTVREDKRLSGEAFREVTGYQAPPWPVLIAAMRKAHLRSASQWITA